MLAIFGARPARFFVTNPQLSRHRLGVRHPDKAWDDEIGRTCSAGLPCECTGAAPDTS
jgi:hypothetical protein